MGWLVRDRSDRLLVLVLAPIIGALMFGLLVAVINSSHVQELSETIGRESMPRIERLSAVRETVDDAEVAISEYVHSAGRPRASAAVEIDATLAQLESDLAAWSEIAPDDPDQRPLVRQVDLSVARFRNAVHRTQELAQTDKDAAATMLANLVTQAANDVADAVATEIEVQAQRGQQLAQEIQVTRRHTLALTLGLTASCVILGVSGALLIRRDRGHRRMLADEHARYQQERVDELDQFAGRLAHDIRNPLSTAMLAADLIHGDTQEGSTRQLAERIRRSLSRAEDITEGLLAFARAGGRPDPGARADVPAIVREIVADCRPVAEDASAELVALPVPAVSVACSPGVYLSMLGNLVGNALKYMGDQPQRKVTVRVSHRQGMVRTEVIDTGPGIAPDVAGSVFEPYVRGPTAGQRGLGLGLATVKRLAEGHGGKVGLSSQPGAGSTFWFELPHAGPSDLLDREREAEAYAVVSH